jgi:hypothetical protein
MGSVLGDVRRRNPLPAYFLRRRVQRNAGQSGRPLVPRPQAALPGAVQHRRLSRVGLWGVVRGEHLIWFPAFFGGGLVAGNWQKKSLGRSAPCPAARVSRRGGCCAGTPGATPAPSASLTGNRPARSPAGRASTAPRRSTNWMTNSEKVGIFTST